MTLLSAAKFLAIYKGDHREDHHWRSLCDLLGCQPLSVSFILCTIQSSVLLIKNHIFVREETLLAIALITHWSRTLKIVRLWYHRFSDDVDRRRLSGIIAFRCTYISLIIRQIQCRASPHSVWGKALGESVCVCACWIFVGVWKLPNGFKWQNPRHLQVSREGSPTQVGRV